MHKTNVLLIIALALAMAATLTLNRVGTAFAQGSDSVGVVVAYTPGQSITIVDKSGTQHQYMLSSSLKILPSGRENTLAVGSFVTIIAPASLDNGKQTAVGIVVHPQVLPGWNMSAMTTTPLSTGTAEATFTPPATGTAMETPTPTPTGTPTPATTETPTGTLTETSTPTPTPAPGGTATTTNAFTDWLRTLIRQLLTNG